MPINPTVAAAIETVAAVLASAGAIASFINWRGLRGREKALGRASVVDLVEDTFAAREILDSMPEGGLIAFVRGRVAPLESDSTVLMTIAGDPACVVREERFTEEFSLGTGSRLAVRRISSIRDSGFELTPVSGNRPTVSVPRGTVEVAERREPGSATDLLDAGTEHSPNRNPTLSRLLKALTTGRVEGAAVRKQWALPVGVLATMAGCVQVQGLGTHSPRIVIGPAPGVGLQLTTASVRETLDAIRSETRGAGWATLAFAALATALSMHLSGKLEEIYRGWLAGNADGAAGGRRGRAGRAGAPAAAEARPDGLPPFEGADAEDEVAGPAEGAGCVVCLQHKKVVLLLPCRHLALCVSCARRIVHSDVPRERSCPLCNEGITAAHRIFA